MVISVSKTFLYFYYINNKVSLLKNLILRLNSAKKSVKLNLKKVLNMSYEIYANRVATISELKKNPMVTLASASDEPLIILKSNKPVCYCIPPALYEAMLDIIDDMELIRIVKEREGEESLEVNINDL